MKNKLIPYAVFFVLASLYAYYASTLNPYKPQDGQDWLQIGKGTIEALTLQSDEQVLNVSKDTSSDRYWLDVRSAPKPGAEASKESDRFLASDSLLTVFEGFSPLRVNKVLGKAEGLKLEEFGLDKTTHSLKVTYGNGKNLSLRFGKRSFQSTEIFALDEGQNTVLLLDRQFLSPLDRPKARLALVQPYSFKLEDVTGATISHQAKSTEYLQLKKGDSKKWVRKEKPEIVDEAFRNWLDKFLKLKIESYPKEDEIKGIEQAELKLSILFQGEKGQLDILSLFEQKGESGSRYWMKSKNLPIPVGLEKDKVELLLNDLSSIQI